MFIVEKLKILQRKRLIEIFKTSQADDAVTNLIEEITADIRFNEEKLKEIKKYKPQSDIDAKIKSNVEIIIAKRLQDITQEMRIGQREYASKIMQLHGADPSKIDTIDDANGYDDDLELNQVEITNMKHRDKEIQEVCIKEILGK